jgi:DNA-binding SARP family transcriptional activator
VIEPSVQVSFRILGPLEIRAGQAWTGIQAPKWRALLAVLLLQPGELVSTGRLIDELWGEQPPATAANLVSVYVHRLRRLLGEPSGQDRGTSGGCELITRPPGYQLRLAPGSLDADRFAALAADGRRELAAGNPERAAAQLGEALGLWRGRALADVPASPLISAEQSRLEETRADALALRIEADLRCGRHGQVIPELQRLLADRPLREELWALLMQAQHGAGRQAAALAAYARAREVIADELGVDPGPDLQRLYQEILRADASAAAVTAGATDRAGPAVPDPRPPGQLSRSADVNVERPPSGADAGGSAPDRARGPAQARAEMPVPAQLPADIADFTGRASQVTQLCGLLAGAGREANPEAVPVVLVMGSGGLGKTTLAVHAAHLLAAEFPDGQLYASLLGATQPADPAEVLARFLRELGMDPAHIPVGEEERAAAFRTLLAGRRLLVVLDDARDAAQVRSLLPGSSSCAVVITARGRLPELVGSRILDLDVLPEAEARALFGRVAGEDRAAAEPAATEQVLTACAGLPLAIRIAGARLAARGGWNVHYLAGRLADERRRLDELRAGNLAVRASFEVSFASLSGAAGAGGVDPARAFRLLGVWTGPSIPLGAAAALLGVKQSAAEDALEVLVDAHLLDSPAPDQYRFHDLLRVYAADRARAEESEASRQQAITRALAWYLHTAEAAARIISPQHARVPLGPVPDGVEPLAFGTLDEALAWCEEQRAGLVAAVGLAAAAGLDEAAWQLPAAAMSFFYRRSHWADWVSTHEVGLASARALGDRRAEAWMLNNLGMAYGIQRQEQCVDCFEQALALYRELGDLRGEGRAATNVASAHINLRQFREALDAAERSLAILRQAGNLYGEGITLGVLGCAYRELGRFAEAIECFQQAIGIFRELNDRDSEADVLSDLGDCRLGTDEVADAISCYRESLTIRREIGDRHGQAATLKRLGTAVQHTGDLAEARELLAESLALFDELGDHASSAQVREALTTGRQVAG